MELLHSLRRHIGLIARLAVSAAVLFYIARKIDWAQSVHDAAAMNPRWLLAAFLCFGPMLAATAWRWQILLRVQDITVSWWQALQLCLVGQFFNAFLLGSTGGDVVKIYYVTRATPEKKAAAALSVVVDRIFGLMVLLLIALGFCFAQYAFLTSQKEAADAVYATLTIAAGAVVFGLASSQFTAIRTAFQKMGWWEKLPLHGVLDHLITAYERYGSAWRSNGACVLISIANHSFNFVLAYCIALALGFQVPLWPFISTLPIFFLLSSLPISISGLGVREGLAIILLKLVGIDNDHAVTFSLTFFAVMLAWSLVGALFYLRYQTPVELPRDPTPVDAEVANERE